MPDYEKLYFQLFAASADAIEAIERMEIIKARDILITAQQKCEETYISEE